MEVLSRRLCVAGLNSAFHFFRLKTVRAAVVPWRGLPRSYSSDTTGSKPGEKNNVSAMKELRSLLRVSAPAFVHNFFTYSLTSVVFLFIGRLGSFQLSVASLAFSIFYLTGASFAHGLTLGIETISGQAHGAGNKQLTTHAYIQGIIVSTTAALVVSLLWCRSEWILVKLGQDPQISSHAASVLQLMIPYLFMETFFTCKGKSLTSRGIVKPTMISSTTSMIMSLPLCWYLIFETPLEIYGMPTALAITSLVGVAILTILARPFKLPKLQSVKQMVKGLSTYVVVTLPGLATLCSEWWVYESFTLLAGLLSRPEISLGMMGAANSIINISFVFALGMGAGVLARVSNLIGGGQKKMAIQSVKTAMAFAVTVESSLLIFLSVFADSIGKIWFTDPSLAAEFAAVVPLIGITEWGSGLSYVLGAILRSCNRGRSVFLANFLSYWFVGLPLGVYLGFGLDLGVKGFWTGLALSSQLQFCALSLAVANMDYEVEVKRAKKLTKIV